MMFSKITLKLFFLTVLLSQFLANCCDYEKLDRRATAFLGRIGECIDSDTVVIQRCLDFVIGINAGDVAKYTPDSFNQLCEETRALESSNEVFISFVDNCHTLYNGSHDDVTKISVHLLLRKILEKSKSHLSEFARESVLREEQKQKLISQQGVSGNASDIESGVKGLNISVSEHVYEEDVNTSSIASVPVLSGESNDVSVFMASSPNISASSDSEFVRNVYMLYLDRESFNESSHRYYKKTLSSPICVRAKVVTNLRDISTDLYIVLGNALLEIDAQKDLVEIILTRGSSVQFNQLFPYLECIYQNHCASGKPVMIVYSSTSASQKAYEKLFHLGGISKKAHFKLDEVEGVNPVGIMSPLKPMKKVKTELLDNTCVLDCSESEISDQGKVDLAITKLKALHSPIIVHFSPDVKSTSLNPLATRETVDSGIYKIFYGILETKSFSIP